MATISTAPAGTRLPEGARNGVFPQPIPGIKILPPLGRPPAGAQPVGYAMVDPEPGCLKCSTLSQAGILVVILLAIFFWPLAFLPCLFPAMHEKAQRAMYAVPEAPVAAKF